jgi:hypothetical protein
LAYKAATAGCGHGAATVKSRRFFVAQRTIRDDRSRLYACIAIARNIGPAGAVSLIAAPAPCRCSAYELSRKDAPMLRYCLTLAVLLATTTLPSGGCRSCSDCHDYDPPVANCDCPGGIHRAGSNSPCDCETGDAYGQSACGCNH